MDFIINRQSNSDYLHTISLYDSFHLHYTPDTPVSIYHHKTSTLRIIGYAFDTREPGIPFGQRATVLFEEERFRETVEYLNGQFIIILETDERLYIYQDATASIPLYATESLFILTNNPEKAAMETEEKLSRLPSNVFLELCQGEYILLEDNLLECSDREMEVELIDLLKNQYKYFKDKSICIDFKGNKYSKMSMAVVGPVLFNQFLYVEINNRDSPAEKLKRENAEMIAHNYRMTYLEEYNEKVAGIMKRESSVHLKNQIFSSVYEWKEDGEEELFSYISINRYRHHSENGVINLPLYDPMNSRILIRMLSQIDVGEKELLDKITRQLYPALNFYDFSRGQSLAKTVLQNRRKLSQKEAETKKEWSFYNKASDNGFIVSHNLGGSHKLNGITVYPKSPKIKKTEVFSLEFLVDTDELVLIESFYENHIDESCIMVSVNDDEYSINHFKDGKFFNTVGKLTIKMKYSKNRNSESWKKAGRLKVSRL
ncbi:hypothetical protein [Salinicoccus luteus]|uniref:hypothetical protein n=1 Tax=Salinicoccus luteus TaxID=367840 RepID=UPI0004E1D60A|nr:hypothetical protein [Salinicoccus luteus]